METLKHSGNLFQCLIPLTMNIVFPWSRQISSAMSCNNCLSCFCLSTLRKVCLYLLYCSLLGSWRQQSDHPSAFFSSGWTNTFLLVCHVLQSPNLPNHQLLLGASKARHYLGWSCTRAKQKEIITLWDLATLLSSTLLTFTAIRVHCCLIFNLLSTVPLSAELISNQSPPALLLLAFTQTLPLSLLSSTFMGQLCFHLSKSPAPPSVYQLLPSVWCCSWTRWSCPKWV